MAPEQICPGCKSKNSYFYAEGFSSSSECREEFSAFSVCSLAAAGADAGAVFAALFFFDFGGFFL